MTKPRYYIGLMSGSSADAIDAVVVSIDGDKVSMVASHSRPIDTALRSKIFALTRPSPDELARSARLDVELGGLFADAALTVMNAASLSADDIVAIGSHGQTLRHDPDGEYPYTLQIGDPHIIAERPGVTTVADFRRRALAAGGQGAPLVPAFHAAVFAKPGESTAVVNIGGIANVTLIDEKGGVRGFDTGPGNCLLDAWILECRDERFDASGGWARTGVVDQALYDHLMADPFFAKLAPKSTGVDYFSSDWLGAQLTLPKLAPETVQRTLLELTASSIAEALEAHTPSHVAICGGGAQNTLLIERLSALLAPTPLEDTSQWGIHPDWVEATAFAWLASQRLAMRNGNEPGVTGAAGYRILGSIYPGG